MVGPESIALHVHRCSFPIEELDQHHILARGMLEIKFSDMELEFCR